MSKRRTLKRHGKALGISEANKLKRENVILWSAILEFGKMADAGVMVLPETVRRIVSEVVEKKAKL